MDNLVVKVQSKLNAELQSYERDLLKLSKETIVSQSYKTVIAQAIVIRILSYYTFSDEELQKMLKMDNLLEFLSQLWLRNDSTADTSAIVDIVYDELKNEFTKMDIF